MNQPKRLLTIMAGGTGGHVFPGLTVAHRLINQGWQIRWLGTADRIEANLVPKHGIEIDFISISGLRGKGLITMLLAPVRILKAWIQARTVMKRYKPDIVLGMGGYVSGPGGLAAWSLGIPIILHEQNTIAGLTNKWLAKIATKVTQAFPGTIPDAEVVGNPVCINILSLPLPKQRLISREGPMRVLVIGGSQGAQILNKTMPLVAEKLANAITIWHQSGKGSRKIVEQAYAKIKRQIQYKVAEFIDDMASAYAWADIAICRSGALTVSEIAVVGLPAVFVPFQHKDRQQYWNALLLEKAGAAKIFEQSKFTADMVATTLSNWNRKILLEMAERARRTAILDATERIVNRVEVTLIAKLNS